METNNETRELRDLSKELLVLRLGFGKLKAAVRDAVSPITGAFLDGLQSAVFGAIRWVKELGGVIAALLGTSAATDAVTKSQKKLRIAAARTRRTLADFDEIQRLNAPSGSGYRTVEIPARTVTISAQAQAIADKIRAILASINLEPAKAAFRELGQVLRELGKTISDSLLWAWHNVLVPLGKWTIQAAVPAVVNALTAAFSALSAILAPVLSGLQSLLGALAPVASFLGDTLRMALVSVTGAFRDLGRVFSEKAPQITAAFRAVGDACGAIFAKISPMLSNLRLLFTQTLAGMGEAGAEQTGALMELFSGLAEFLAGTFTGNWKRAWEGIKTVAKASVNGLIGLVNGMLSGLVAGLNAAIRALNRIQITLPGWLPQIGGKQFSLKLPTVSAPKIPYLAQGAVLPANAPFLAVLGDQRHGTNIEAPLATIQEAVASVLLPGQNESNELLSQLIAAVRSIRVGDDVIGRANARYTLHQRTVTGW